ncbi:pyrimidine utilization protein A [Paracraurococcus lichenis]|uniref:Pyrimidine monooxygenase RutA n=1 Tax=Paracraurococcus lichenis TaxID=3064888 RepID=A0ABT9E4Z0_9PROT|nr:pyrimidine utilization protein A [Paracraurococcus sp. LOR1-02]MDO9711228.1 pyrimidine utilization protein A [Paracraurococcus sp. LOR1-02]
MDIGVFIPIGNNGWLISSTSPQYMPSFDLNRQVVQRAEHYGFDFALSMIKLRGFGGPTEFWDHNLESFTLMAGLAAVTTRIRLYASVAVLTLPPAIVARMASTIDDISGGRFGVNIVSGWQQAEYDQMGLWPGERHFANRYDYCAEYVQVMRELWATGRSDFQGSYFRMKDCRVSPRPKAGRVPVVCAGQSPAGIRFAAQYGDYNFCAGAGQNDPGATAPNIARLVQATAETGRACGAYVLYMVIAAETDEAALATWERYRDGVDTEAVAWLTEQAGADRTADATSTARWMAMAKSAVNFNMGLLVGSYATVAQLLDEAAAVPGTSGLMLVFDDFIAGMEAFGERIQPLMRCRQDRIAQAA